MTDDEIGSLFDEVRSSLNTDMLWLIEHRPLLAHYTSIEVVEKILKNEEL
jgi:hypothetical protein